MLITKEDYINERKKYSNGNIWQSIEWGIFQSNIGKEVFSLMGKNYLCIVIKQKLPFGQSYLQVPKGPMGTCDEDFINDVVELAQKSGSIFVRIISENAINVNCSYFKVKKDQFPMSSLIIDLTQDRNDILMNMKQKGRYNIRIAQKKGIQVKEEKDSALASKIFYELMKDTSERDGFSGHSMHTYKEMIDSLGDKIKILIAYFEGVPISAGIFTFSDGKAVYYYGASANKYRNLMAPYLIQWEAICISQDIGCKTYDFLGIASDENDEKDPLHGVTQFKIKFGGEVVSYPNPIDIPISYPKYLIYKFVNFFRYE